MFSPNVKNTLIGLAQNAKRILIFIAFGTLVIFGSGFCLAFVVMQSALPLNSKFSHYSLNLLEIQQPQDGLFLITNAFNGVFIAQNNAQELDTWYEKEGWKRSSLEEYGYFRSRDHAIKIFRVLFEPILFINLESIEHLPTDSTKIEINSVLFVWWHK
jgi:hypothetical protein